MTKNGKFRFFLGLYFASIFSLFLYSFTQIDLSLTFSRIEVLRNAVKSFQYIGYFNRPLSGVIFSALIIILFGFYIYFLKLARDKKIERKTLWKIILSVSAILVFSYNAFSYDLFNYIFDAKIFTHYNSNPYLHKALDFPTDPMLSFMRWTHRVYPYGPAWLFLTVPLSYIGLNLFLPTLFLFKFLMGACFLASLYFIGKILRKVAPGTEPLGIAVFGLNPMILIESLVSPHLDIVMIFFALCATSKLLEKKYIFAFLLLAFSIGIKFATVFLAPIFLYIIYLQIKNKKINWELVFGLTIISMFLTVIVSSIYSGNFQPWYLLLPLSFAALLSHKYYVVIPVMLASFLALFTYLPYLYLGNWDSPVPQILRTIYIAGISLSVAIVLTYKFAVQSRKN